MTDNIINLQECRQAAENKEAKEIVDFVTSSEERMIEYLARAYVELERSGSQDLGVELIKAGLELRTDQIYYDILKRIEELKGTDDGTSSD